MRREEGGIGGNLLSGRDRWGGELAGCFSTAGHGIPPCFSCAEDVTLEGLIPASPPAPPPWFDGQRLPSCP